MTIHNSTTRTSDTRTPFFRGSWYDIERFAWDIGQNNSVPNKSDREMSYKNVLQKCPTKMSYKNIPTETLESETEWGKVSRCPRSGGTFLSQRSHPFLFKVSISPFTDAHFCHVQDHKYARDVIPQFHNQMAHYILQEHQTPFFRGILVRHQTSFVSPVRTKVCRVNQTETHYENTL
jgi:hypothetical protein